MYIYLKTIKLKAFIFIKILLNETWTKYFIYSHKKNCLIIFFILLLRIVYTQNAHKIDNNIIIIDVYQVEDN